MPYLQVKCFEMALKTSIWDYYTTKKASYALQRPYKPFKGQKFERWKNLTNLKLKGVKNVTKIGFNAFFHLEIFWPSWHILAFGEACMAYAEHNWPSC